jgi:site-specific recombinase XerD
MKVSYKDQRKALLRLRANKLLKTAPPFLAEFIRGISAATSADTRLGYIYDLQIFFRYLSENKFLKEIDSFTLDDMANVASDDIESFLDYLTVYSANGVLFKNGDDAKGRKFSSIKKMFRFFTRRRKLENNPADAVDPPKIREKNIIILTDEEALAIITNAETGAGLPKKAMEYHSCVKNRDVAIIYLLLGTGIRISELVGIDADDLDFSQNSVKITRKGGAQSVVYFGEKVKERLEIYSTERKKNPAEDSALFLSRKDQRITDRAVQNLVKKYSNGIGKNISPHKFRSTFGTNLYRASRDIYLVAEVLGHKDVNTTKKHYARLDDERRKEAPSFVKLP